MGSNSCLHAWACSSSRRDASRAAPAAQLCACPTVCRSKRQRLSPPRQQQQQQQDDLPAAPPAPEQPAQQQQQQPLRLYLAGCHLAPFAEGAQARLAQLQALVAHAREQGADVMIVAGDLNMRNAEEPGVEVLGLQVRWAGGELLGLSGSCWGSQGGCRQHAAGRGIHRGRRLSLCCSSALLLWLL